MTSYFIVQHERITGKIRSYHHRLIFQNTNLHKAIMALDDCYHPDHDRDPELRYGLYQVDSDSTWIKMQHHLSPSGKPTKDSAIRPLGCRIGNSTLYFNPILQDYFLRNIARPAAQLFEPSLRPRERAILANNYGHQPDNDPIQQLLQTLMEPNTTELLAKYLAAENSKSRQQRIIRDRHRGKRK